jgi:hypothetical protein
VDVVIVYKTLHLKVKKRRGFKTSHALYYIIGMETSMEK